MRRAVTIATTSASVLGFEIVLMRALAITRWHHFAYMIVSLALLGFGASGALIALLRARVARHADGWIAAFATAFAVAIPSSFALSQRVPFNVFELGWDATQYLYLLEYYAILFVPFLFGATVIGLCLVQEGAAVHQLYFWNLLGSGVGACGTVVLLYGVSPEHVPLALCAAAGVGAVAAAGRGLRGAAVPFAVAVCTLLWFGIVSPLALRWPEHKALSALLREPDARIVERRSSPLGLVHVVDSPTIRLTPGVSIAYTGDLPRQRALVVDAASVSAINHVTDGAQLLALDYTAAALPYHLLQRPRTLVVGAGGGGDIRLAQHHRCREIIALEMDPVVAALLRGSQSEYAQQVFEQPGTELRVAEARGYLTRCARHFDLIQLPLVESFGTAGLGVQSLAESYLYTVESIAAMLDRLAPGGLLCITRWADTPPRDSIRLFATVTEALTQRGVASVGDHVLFIRSWSTATIVASVTPVSAGQVAALRRFCDGRSFDLVWAPGMAIEEANRYHILPEPHYARATRELLSPRRRAFIALSPFDIAPTTDDRPYHSLSVRWRGLKHLRSTMGDRWVSFADWGYIVLIATVAQAALAAVVLVLVPLLVARGGRVSARLRVGTLAYFAALGVGYMLVELCLMQKLSLFLASPVHSAALVLSTFLVFSGAGSLASGRLARSARRGALTGALGAVGVGLILWVAGESVLGHFVGRPLLLRCVIAAVYAAPLAFFMGMPFPSGLRLLAERAPQATPWAWGINGSASVVGAALTPVLAVSFGFRTTLLLAFGAYGAAALAVALLGRAGECRT